MTPLVGRKRDMQRLRAYLARDDGPLTIVGEAGIGKTRLAAELAASRAGAVFCELGEARDLEGICRVVAARLGSLESQSLAQVGRLLARVAPPLLVLDRFEHLQSYAADVLQGWRELAPGVRIVITSRARLQLPKESVHEVGRLGLERRGSRPSEAMQLLLERLARAGRAVHDDTGDDAMLARIADRLEGVPLALEIIAPKIALLGARTVLGRLERHFELLSPLRATLESSWDLLGAADRAALCDCATFAGTFDARAAEHVLGDDALQKLQDLRMQSLLIVTRPPNERFGLAYSVREFVVEKNPLRDPQRARHAAYYAALASQLGARSSRALDQLDLERHNLIDAAEYALSAGDSRRALALAVALHELAWLRGPYHAYEALLDRALAGAGDAPHPPIAEALSCRGRARRRFGNFAAARADIERAIALATTLGERGIEARARRELGSWHTLAGAGESAATELAAALAAQTEIEDHVGQAYTYFAQGVLRCELGQPDEAAFALESARRRFEELEIREMAGSTLSLLADAALSRGRIDDAVDLTERALLVHRAEKNLVWEAMTLCHRGAIELTRHRFEQAVAWYDRGLPFLRTLGDATYGGFLAQRALAAVELQRLDAARVDLELAVQSMRGKCAPAHFAIILAWLGGVRAEAGQLAEAEAAFAEARDLCVGTLAPAARAVLDAERRQLDLRRSPDARRDLHAALPSLLDAPAVRGFFYVRWSYERLRRRVGAPFAAASTSTPSSPHRLLVNAEASRLVSPRGAAHSLARKATLQRLLARLVEAHASRPGQAVDHDDLIASGWPGEGVGHVAAMNRLRVAVARLRQLGLDEWLVGQRGGYLLDPELAVVVQERSART